MVLDNLFRRARLKWHDTKPIRGRATDMRPLGERRRDWERVVKVDEDTYAYRHHSTNVLTFHADGRVVIDSGGWISKTTTDFLNKYSPFYVRRAQNKYWVCVGGKTYPVSENVPLTLREYETGWRAEGRDLFKRVLNHQKMREMRTEIKPFMESAERMLAVTDGWICSDTLAEYGTRQSSYGWHAMYKTGFYTQIHAVKQASAEPGNGWFVGNVTNLDRIYEVMREGTDEEQMALMLTMFQLLDKDSYEQMGPEHFKFKVNKYELRKFVSKLLRGLDAFQLVPVEDGCYTSNVVL